MSIDNEVVYLPGLGVGIGDSDRVAAFRAPLMAMHRELPLKYVLMQLRQPLVADCHWWRLTIPTGNAGEIVTITEDAEPDIRGIIPSRLRRTFLRQGDVWIRLAQDPNVDYLLQTGEDPWWIRVYCAGPMPGWVRDDELMKA